MSILVVGLSHKSAPVALLERAAVSGDHLVKLLHDVHSSEHAAEAMVVSTCNRVEVYVDVDKFHGGVSEISDLLARHSGIPLERLTPHLYVHYEDRAVQHLFSVACGLDSMVIGEGQILGQVRQALKLAQEEGTLGRVLNEFGQQALRVGKRARTETGIDRAGVTLVSVGLDIARRVLGPLPGVRTLVVGAGSMSSLAAATLARERVGEIVIANRTYERGVRLVRTVQETGVPARAVRLTDLDAALAESDLVISCTGAAGLVVTAEAVARATADRSAAAAPRPLFLLDLALPHDVDPGVRALPGVTLVDLESLRSAGKEGAGAGPDDIEAVKRIVCEEVAAFLSAARAARVAPTVVALRSKAAEVVRVEMERLAGRLPDLDARQRDEIANTMRRVVDKLLHAPTVRVKELASSPNGDSYAAALRELFDLDPKAPEAVTRADVVVGMDGPAGEEAAS